MIWMKIETHDYMDMYPNTSYKLFHNEILAKDWEKYMRENYSGGVTTVIGPATKQEILDYLEAFKIEAEPELLENINNDEYYNTSYLH